MCQCDCGNFKAVLLCHLRSGKTTSCRCIQKQLMSQAFTIHGLSHTRCERIYKDILRRCNIATVSNYKNY